MSETQPATEPPRSVVIIGNLRSRRTSELYSKAIEALVARGITILESHTVGDGGDVVKRVSNAIADEHEYVIVAGGDGTMTSVVGAFAHARSVLGVLPLGTGNSFAQSLGMEPTMESAVESIVTGRVAEVDLGVVNGRHFANFATIGLSSTIARSTPNALKKVLGPLAYAVSGVAPLLRSSSFDAKVTWKKSDVTVRTHQLIVANGRYFGFTPILPDATIVDGELSLFTTSGCSRWEVARMFVAFHRGRQTMLADAEYFSAPAIDVDTTPAQYVDIDGEAFGKTPARFSIDSKALRVLVPQDFTGK
ncbi:MAG: diacylglycerol kinase [Vulcanimicrobiaceae bacterium]